MAKLTNREKYESYRAQILAKDAEAIAAILPDGVPSQFYQIRKYEAAPVIITGVGVYHRGIYKPGSDQRMTKADVELAAKAVEEWTAPTLDQVLVHYEYKEEFGRVTGAHPHAKITADPMMAWTAEELAPEIERRKALYAPRDGHKPCDYCRKKTPEAGLKDATIFYRERGQSRTMVRKHCSAHCAYADQCSHEG